MPKPLLQVSESCSSSCREALARVAEIVKRDVETNLGPRPPERLVDGVTSHAVAVAANEEVLSPSPLFGMDLEEGEDVWRHVDITLPGVSLGILVICLRGLEQLNPVLEHPDDAILQVDILDTQAADLTSTQAAPRCKNDGGTVSLRADRGDELCNLVGSGDLAFTGLSRPCSGDIAGVAVDSLIADGCVQDGT